MGSGVMQKIEGTIIRPKYLQCELIDKPLVFYGSLDSFKYVLANFPKLSFKKFVDIRERDTVISYLRLKSEIVMTNLRVCECTQEWGFIECKMIFVEVRRGSTRIVEKREENGCQK